MSAVWAVGTVTSVPVPSPLHVTTSRLTDDRGPLIGAGFSQNVSWRWIFWINLPVIAIGAVLVVFFLNQAAIPGGIPAKLRRL